MSERLPPSSPRPQKERALTLLQRFRDIKAEYDAAFPNLKDPKTKSSLPPYIFQCLTIVDRKIDSYFQTYELHLPGKFTRDEKTSAVNMVRDEVKTLLPAVTTAAAALSELPRKEDVILFEKKLEAATRISKLLTQDIYPHTL
jgi:hypothetical protein